jgi:hypothetical protein
VQELQQQLQQEFQQRLEPVPCAGRHRYGPAVRVQRP